MRENNCRSCGKTARERIAGTGAKPTCRQTTKPKRIAENCRTFVGHDRSCSKSVASLTAGIAGICRETLGTARAARTFGQIRDRQKRLQNVQIQSKFSYIRVPPPTRTLAKGVGLLHLVHVILSFHLACRAKLMYNISVSWGGCSHQFLSCKKQVDAASLLVAADNPCAYPFVVSLAIRAEWHCLNTRDALDIGCRCQREQHKTTRVKSP